MREIVDVGFGSGLLKEGMIQYPMEQPMGNAEEVASVAWTKVWLFGSVLAPSRAWLIVQILETSVAAAKTGGGHKMSLWVDVEMGRPIEVEVCHCGTSDDSSGLTDCRSSLVESSD